MSAGRKSQMKVWIMILSTLLLTCTLLLLGGMVPKHVYAAATDDIKIDAAHFPDAVFRDYVSKNFDKNSDNYLQKGEIGAVTAIDVGYSDVKDLTGVQYFTKLKKLECGGDQLASLDVGKNVALTYLNCDDNQLTSLDVSHNLALEELWCNSNQLKSLDVSHNLALKELWCENNQLASLDVSKNRDLTDLCCDDNQFKSLDVKKNTALKQLRCNYNQLATIDVSNNTALEDLECQGNQLKKVDVSKNTALLEFYCDDNQLSTLNISKNQKLISLFCSGNKLTTLDISQCPELNYLFCESNNLKNLDVDQASELRQIDCRKNQLLSLNLSDNKLLYTSEGDSTVGVQLLSGQTRTVEAKLQNGKYIVDLKSYDSALDPSKVKVTNDAGGIWNTKAGTLTFKANPKGKKVTYTYSTGNPNSAKYPEYNDLSVTLTINDTHTFSAWQTTKQPTCTEEGTKERTCSICGYKETSSISALGHEFSSTWEKNDKYHWHVCTRCGKKDKEDAAHTFSKWKTVEQVTKQKPGKKERTCTVCGYPETQAINFTYDKSTRIYGNTRYETAIQTANTLKAEMGGGKFGAAVIAYGENYPDALSGTYLANVKKAPLLLANAKDANTEENTINYVRNNVNARGRVYILGGPGLVSSKLESTLRSQGYSVVRLYGNDRYQTNIKILNAAGVKNGQDLLVCTGENYPDALSTSALGKPILLIGRQAQPTSAQKTIIQGKNVYIIGGTAAISDRIKNSISRSAKRISGSDRYDTSAKIAKQFCKNPTTAVLAYGQNFPDGLAGGTLAYKVNAPLLLATSSSVGNKSIANYVDSTQINKMYVLGGPGLISDNAAQSVLRFDK